MKALTQDEILKVLKAAADNPRDLAMFLLGVPARNEGKRSLRAGTEGRRPEEQ